VHLEAKLFVLVVIQHQALNVLPTITTHVLLAIQLPTMSVSIVSVEKQLNVLNALVQLMMQTVLLVLLVLKVVVQNVLMEMVVVQIVKVVIADAMQMFLVQDIL
jgi:hypothetical protein